MGMKQPEWVRRIVCGTIDAYFPHRVWPNYGENAPNFDMFVPMDAWCHEHLGDTAHIVSLGCIDKRKMWIRWHGFYRFADKTDASAFRLIWG